MAVDANGNPIAADPAATPPVTDPATPPVADPSTLPSQNQEVDYSAFELSDETKSKMKDGKLLGRFGSVDEVLVKLKEAEDFRAQHGNNQQNQQAQTSAEQAALVAKQTVGGEIEQAFIANGMILTDEMVKKGTDAGIDARDIKLRSIDIRDSANSAHAIVGGKENYDAMIGWARENMDKEQVAAFNSSLGTNMSSYAIKGLHGDYQKALADGVTTPRISGQPVNQGITAYGSRRELYADKDKAELAKKRGNTNDWNIYQKKLKATRALNGGISALPRY